VTDGPLHGPLTFAEWLRTCTVEVMLCGPAAEVTVELLAADPFTRVIPAARRAA
jgi:hypothetical protein